MDENKTFQTIKDYVEDKIRLFNTCTTQDGKLDDRSRNILEVLEELDRIIKTDTEPEKILIIIQGGNVQSVVKPIGVELEIRDFDVEGVDAEGDERCKKDEDGDWYQEMFWEATEEVT